MGDEVTLNLLYCFLICKRRGNDMLREVRLMDLLAARWQRLHHRHADVTAEITRDGDRRRRLARLSGP